jgi:hypothetical protein
VKWQRSTDAKASVMGGLQWVGIPDDVIVWNLGSDELRREGLTLVNAARTSDEAEI